MVRSIPLVVCLVRLRARDDFHLLADEIGRSIGSQPKPVRRAEPKVGRNDPCPCGSGKKYKKCHGA
jgi:preprotein translocase subunit SecA